MDLLTQYADLLSAKHMLEGRLLIIAKAQFALDKEAFFTVFSEAKNRHGRHFEVSDEFRINDEGECEVWEYGRFGGDDECIHAFSIDLSLEHSTDIELLRHEEPKCWTAFKNKRIAVYEEEKATAVKAAEVALAAKRRDLERQLAALCQEGA